MSSEPISFRRPGGGGRQEEEEGGGGGAVGGGGSSGARAGAADLVADMAFSPSNMTPRTLDGFHKAEASDPVPLQTKWTFWLDRY